MNKLAFVGIFATAFLMTANMQMYIHSLRLGIYAWHIFLPVVPAQIVMMLMLGNVWKVNLETRIFAAWWLLMILLISFSLLFVDSDARAVQTASQLVIIGAISVTFLIVAQQTQIIKAGMYGVAVAVVFAAGVSIAEFLNPDFNMVVDQRYESRTREGVIQRVGGLYVNANLNARVMALGMFVSVFFLPKAFRLVFCLFIGAAIFTTVSRAGISIWVLAIVFLFVLGQFAKGKLLPKIAGAVFIVGFGAMLATGKIPELVESVELDTYLNESMIERLSGNFFTQEDGSTSTRKDLVNIGIELYAENPILGSGLGNSNQLGDTGLGPHNTFIEIAVELGTFGLLLFASLALIPLYLRSVKAGAFVLIYFFSALFSDGLLSMPSHAYILPAGVVLLALLDRKVSLRGRQDLHHGAAMRRRHLSHRRKHVHVKRSYTRAKPSP